MITARGHSFLIVGFAQTGQAVARVVGEQGGEVVVVDDAPREQARAYANELGIELVVAPDATQLQGLCERSDFIVVSPGVAPRHAVFRVRKSTPLMSEIELAYELGVPPVVAITGTNGKTSVTALVTAMLVASGMKAKAVGNIGSPLIEVVGSDLDTAVTEVSSFQLSYVHAFRPKVATWLNFSDDHLDWHDSRQDYAQAKANVWATQQASDIAVANRDDPVVWSYAAKLLAKRFSFGHNDGDFRVVGEAFVGPEGEEVALVSDLVRAYPHDVMNALAAIATARSAGASLEGCRAALRSTPPLRHRVELVGEVNGVQFFDDSKATTPSAVVAALGGMSSVVLIAGGRNKGLSFDELRSYVGQRDGLTLRAVVAIGEAAEEIASTFEPAYLVERSDSMAAAVKAASRLAQVGDQVLLSPGCASFDWYRSYAERGDDFVHCIEDLFPEFAGKS